MSGREEQDLQREKWIQEKLNNQSQVLTDYMLSLKNRKTSSTRKAYLGYIIEFVNYMNSNSINFYEAKPMHIDRYIDYISEGRGHGIVNAKLAAISNFYSFLVKNELAKANPINNDMKLKSNTEKNVIYMTETEEQRVKLKASRKSRNSVRDLCIITLGCATGLRVSAIRNIDIEDIDFENKIIHVVEKGNKVRDVYIGDNTIEMIRTWMRERKSKYGNNTGPLFISQKKNRLSVRTIEEMIHNVSSGVDKHITPHKMRSTCAMKLYNLTGDIYLTAQQLGHKNISTTMIYARATDDKRREAAALLD